MPGSANFFGSLCGMWIRDVRASSMTHYFPFVTTQHRMLLPPPQADAFVCGPLSPGFFFLYRELNGVVALPTPVRLLFMPPRVRCSLFGWTCIFRFEVFPLGQKCGWLEPRGVRSAPIRQPVLRSQHRNWPGFFKSCSFW